MSGRRQEPAWVAEGLAALARHAVARAARLEKAGALPKPTGATVTHPHRMLFRVETCDVLTSGLTTTNYFVDEDKADAFAEKMFNLGFATKVIDANGNIRAEFEQ